MSRLVVILGSLALCACTTTFTGNSYVANGRAGCEQKCRAEGLTMTGMVFMGEYSSACVCELETAPAPAAPKAAAPGKSGSVGGVAPVIIQQQIQERDFERNSFGS